VKVFPIKIDQMLQDHQEVINLNKANKVKEDGIQHLTKQQEKYQDLFLISVSDWQLVSMILQQLKITLLAMKISKS
jgi:cell division FtsZ-interacting protein ZapD